MATPRVRLLAQATLSSNGFYALNFSANQVPSRRTGPIAHHARSGIHPPASYLRAAMIWLR